MATNAAGPTSQEAASEGVSQLIVQLPQAKSATEVFGVFADKVHSIFEGLQHIRYAAAGYAMSPAVQYSAACLSTFAALIITSARQ
jgi:hypothetical protein